MIRPPPTLDIDAVRAFTLVAELQSFTRAAQATATTQSAVSLKLKRLEDRLSAKRDDRTPRSGRLAGGGTRLPPRAADLVCGAGPRAAGVHRGGRGPPIGLSGPVGGPGLRRLITRVNAFDPLLRLDVRINFSHALLEQFD